MAQLNESVMAQINWRYSARKIRLVSKVKLNGSERDIQWLSWKFDEAFCGSQAILNHVVQLEMLLDMWLPK